MAYARRQEALDAEQGPLGAIQTPPPSEAGDGASSTPAERMDAFSSGTYPCPDCTLEVLAGDPSSHAKDCPRYVPQAPTPPAPDDHALQSAAPWAGAFSPLPLFVSDEVPAGEVHFRDAEGRTVGRIVNLEAAPQLDPAAGGTALLATGVGTDSPAVVDLLEQARGGAALALIEEGERQQKAAEELLGRAKSSLELVKHLSGTEGLTVRREPEEVGHPPRFTLLHVKVDAAGLSTVNVLVPVAPWHHVQDAVERFLKSTLTPREYQ